tara:strand:+ start:2590 stop:4230 length:1641 start_codon:yes stop_codon:yes gene_type:complete
MKFIFSLNFFIFFIFFLSKAFANPFASIDSNTLNIAKTDEIYNFLINKVAEGIFFDESNFVEIFLENGDFQVEFLNGQYKGLYKGKWKAENDSICFMYENTNNFDCSKLLYTNDNNGNLKVYLGSNEGVFAQFVNVNNFNTSNQQNNSSNQYTKSNIPAPEGVDHISDEDVVVVSNNYSNNPSDDDLSQLNFNMNRDQIVEVLKNNGCKILASWKRRVITQGQKDSRDLSSKCFKKKMIIVGFEDSGNMEFIADVHYIGNDLKVHFLDDYDKNRARLRVATFQRFSPNLIYNIGAKSAICLNKECLELVWRDSSRKELAFLYLNPNSSPGKAWANKTIESFKIALERPAVGCVIKQDNPCLIYKAEYNDPSLIYLERFMNGPRTPERESLRKMYVNYLQAQILAAEALGLIEVASDLKLLLDYIVSDPSQLDMERVSTSISNGTNQLLKNANSGTDNEEAKKKIDEAHIYAAKAGGEGKLFFSSITAIFSSGTFEDAAGAAEIASRTKGNLAYFYKALKKIREAKNINLTPETEKEFGDAEDIIDI